MRMVKLELQPGSLIGPDSEQGNQALSSESNDPSEEGLDSRCGLTGRPW